MPTLPPHLLPHCQEHSLRPHKPVLWRPSIRSGTTAPTAPPPGTMEQVSKFPVPEDLTPWHWLLGWRRKQNLQTSAT